MPHQLSANHQPNDRYYGYASHILRVIKNHPGRSRSAVELVLCPILPDDEARTKFRDAMRFLVADGLLVEQKEGPYCCLYLSTQKRPKGERISVAASRVKVTVVPSLRTWKKPTSATEHQHKPILPTPTDAEKLKRAEQRLYPLIKKRQRLAERLVSLDEDIDRITQHIQTLKDACNG
jgi:hypothetical protein